MSTARRSSLPLPEVMRACTSHDHLAQMLHTAKDRHGEDYAEQVRRGMARGLLDRWQYTQRTLEDQAQDVATLGRVAHQHVEPLVSLATSYEDLEPRTVQQVLAATALAGNDATVRAAVPRLLAIPWKSPDHEDDNDLAYDREQHFEHAQAIGLALSKRARSRSLITAIRSLVERQAEQPGPQESHEQYRYRQALLLDLGSSSPLAVDLARELATLGHLPGCDTDRHEALIGWMANQSASLLRGEEAMMGALTRHALTGLGHDGKPIGGELQQIACTVLGRTARVA
jgi:hypothetical protein